MAILTKQPNQVKSKQERQEIQQEALSRARDGQTFSNYPAIISGFSARGIPVDEILPRENVFTFNAWKALGRYVRRGEHGIRVVTFREDVVKDKDTDGTEKIKVKSRPWYATVFHVSQTEKVGA